MKKANLVLSIVLTLIAIASRLLPHPPNFTALGAGALFGGAKIARPYNYLLVLFSLFVTDIFLGFHSTMPFVYAAFILSVALGEIMPKKYSVKKTATYALISSTAFFIITNLGVWLVGGIYERSVAGLVTCFVMAIPFYGLTLLGDMLYSLGLFSAYAYQSEKIYKLEVANEQR
ncbi:hypothetical protein HY844_00645 [Candidatus Berkelbacteria bacterium]|nr:hypothetical protein [Candidatus Berkelbacteria bacterium]